MALSDNKATHSRSKPRSKMPDGLLLGEVLRCLKFKECIEYYPACSPCLLVSDDLHSETPWNANMGYTLPGSPRATHNIGLSPLFFERVGEVLIDSGDFKHVLGMRGQDGILQASNDRGDFFALFGSGYIDPSRTLNGVRVYSLRCLVSTNNR